MNGILVRHNLGKVAKEFPGVPVEDWGRFLSVPENRERARKQMGAIAYAMICHRIKNSPVAVILAAAGEDGLDIPTDTLEWAFYHRPILGANYGIHKKVGAKARGRLLHRCLLQAKSWGKGVLVDFIESTWDDLTPEQRAIKDHPDAYWDSTNGRQRAKVETI